jgi:uncharacterized membrane protein YraQ (UPF0718 family)
MSDESPSERLARRPRRNMFDIGLFLVIALGVAGAIQTWRIEGVDAVLKILTEDTLLFLEIVPKVIAGLLIGVFVALLVPSSLVVRYVGANSGLKRLAVATLAGMIMPGGAVSIFPMAAAFLTLGADLGATVAFLTAWHAIGIVRAMIWEMPFLGPDFVFWRFLIWLPFPFIAGLMARFAVRIGARWKSAP